MGDSFDNAMAESFNGLYKWELIYPKGPWRGLDDVEFETLTYVDWFNNRRLHGEIEPGPGFTTPAAFEAAHYRQQNSADQAETQTTEPPRDPGRFNIAGGSPANDELVHVTGDLYFLLTHMLIRRVDRQ